MSNTRYNKVLTLILVILLIAILGIAGYFGYEYYKKYINNKETTSVLQEFDKIIVELPKEESLNDNTNSVEPSNENKEINKGIDTKELYYRGYKVIGKLEMPSVNLQYPILDMLTDAKAIDYSIAMQYGAGVNKVGNTVIIGHNTYNGTFFGKNKKMNIGDSIYATDLNGNRVEYEIYNKYTTPGSDFSYASKNTNGTKELTLVTCENNNKNRLIICAKEKNII
ncbi:MAG TPA: sortase [Clostridia bacterium]|nr:sortase [Clostridia bacterium]